MTSLQCALHFTKTVGQHSNKIVRENTECNSPRQRILLVYYTNDTSFIESIKNSSVQQTLFAMDYLYTENNSFGWVHFYLFFYLYFFFSLYVRNHVCILAILAFVDWVNLRYFLIKCKHVCPVLPLKTCNKYWPSTIIKICKTSWPSAALKNMQDKLAQCYY